jgi:hypothetical protein
MTGIAAPEPCRSVQNGLTVVVPVKHAFGGNQHARIALELPVRGERHPEGTHLAIGSRLFVFIEIVHGASPSHAH